MPRRFDLGRAVLVAGSALLLISLFLDWYDTGQNGWQVFEALDLALAGLAVAGIVAALRPDLTPPWSAWAVPLAATVIVALQIIDPPPAAGPDASADSGAWLALAGSLLMAAGASMSLTSISVTVQVADRDVRRRMAAVDRRGAGDDEEPPAVAAAEDVEEAAAQERGGRGGGLFSPVPPAATSTPPNASDDIERTQPLSAIDEPAEDPDRP
jgi:hypothetical protein